MTTTTLSATSDNALLASRGQRMFLIKLTIVLILTPASFFVGSLFMTFSKTLFLLMVPVLTFGLLSRRFGRILMMDILLMLYIVWIAISIALNNPSSFVTFVGSNAALFLGGYLVGRACIRSAEDFMEFSRFIGICIMVLLPFALYEILTHNKLLLAFFNSIPGLGSHAINYSGKRLGIFRAQVVFVHPIHWGLFASLGFALVMTGLRSAYGRSTRMLWAGLIAIACFISVSSGPFLSLAGQLGLLAYWGLFRRFSHIWIKLMIGMTSFYLILEVLSSRPAYLAILEQIAFSPETAYARQTLIEYGLAQIARTPVFGVGYNAWELPPWMSGSTDNFWLLSALVYGVPAFVFLFSMFLTGMIGAARRNFPEESQLSDQRRAWIITLASLMFSIATVAVWGEIAVVMFLMIGAGAFLLTVPEPGSEQLAHLEQPDTAAPHGRGEESRPARQFTRFGPASRTHAPLSDPRTRMQK